MDRSLVIDFNRAYSMEATPEEKQLVNDMLSVWVKLEPAASRNLSLLRKGILYGMALQKGITAGQIRIRPLREKRQGTKPDSQA